MKPIGYKIAIALAVVAVVAAGIFYYTNSSGNKIKSSFINPAFSAYVSSYTAGVVPANSSILIGLTQPHADSTEIGKEISAKLIELSPKVSGKLTWIDAQTLSFKPDARLQSGQVYEVSFYLSKITEVPKELATFRYSFQVVPQNFEVAIDNVRPYVNTELKRVKIEATLFTADYAEPTLVEKMIEAKQQTKKMALTWTHTSDGKQHAFVVEDVARTDKEETVEIIANGKELNLEKELAEIVTIPSLGDFKLMQATVNQSPTQYVRLQFSDPISENQDLNGLISIEGLSSLEYDIQDNVVLVYPSVRQTGTKRIIIEAGLLNILNYKMKQPAFTDVEFEQVAPLVRIIKSGTILPSTHGTVLPFEAVNLKAVDVKIIRILEQNVLQFLQVNQLNGQGEIKRVGKQLIRKKVSLENTGVTDFSKWNRFTLNLNDFISPEPGAIYQVKISFKQAYSTYACSAEENQQTVLEEEESDDDSSHEYDYYGSYDYYEDYYYDEYYDWEERDNPCHSSYYSGGRPVTQNILASDLGITAKAGADNNVQIFVTNLLTTEPLAGVTVELYDFQQQVIGKTTTDAEGKANVFTREKPFVLVASHQQQKGYLRLVDGESLSLSTFDVSGETIQKGLKGMIYGERGVWRPGDSLYLTFMLEDKAKRLPETHPVAFELINPQGQAVKKIVKTKSVNGFYSFATATEPDAPTGYWQARVKVGETEFYQTVRIETIKPNRLKINLDFGTELLTQNDISGTVQVNWLHGAPGRNLRTTFDLTLYPTGTTFSSFKDYTFEDPSINFYSETTNVFDGNTDEAGQAIVNATLPASKELPGKMTATFAGRVYEEGGNYSINQTTIPYSPYESYVGVKTPEGEKYSGILYLDQPQTIDIATVDANGKGISRDGLEVTLQKLEWRWWWDHSGESLANYVNGTYSKNVRSGVVNTKNGKATWTFTINKPDWGRYFLRVCDPASGHCTGKIIYIDEPGWASRLQNDDNKEGATQLTLATDKPVYEVGEKINLTIPGGANGRALISLENGSRILKTLWLETKAGENKVSIETTEEMTPNIYLHVSLLQPHAQTENDMPMRLYGVVPVKVEDPNTHLNPLIEMPETLEPGKEVTIRISEKAKKEMTYTVAVVDEGLLDITRFKTPDPWSRFYAREALGVKTWDVYDWIIGSYGTNLERLISIGGDAELAAAKEDDARAKRFKPVVKFFGPFTVSAGSSNKHTFTMPNYIGSVKTMVIAGNKGAYGHAEKATPVRKPLMVLATLPRVLGPEEKVTLPVTLFSQQKGIGQVTVTVKTKGPVAVAQSTQTIQMPASGDITIDFEALVKSQMGKATFTIEASAGNLRATDEIEIEVRNPNAKVTRVTEALVEAGKAWKGEVNPVGIAGTNKAMLEISTLPPINLDARLRYLFEYPYGCIEQTTSAVFPQLYLSSIKQLTENEKNAIQRNVTAAIERLKSFLQRDGGFSYWPGVAESDTWGTTYAGHFLLEAEAKGYYVPADMIKKWKKFQKEKTQAWRKNINYYNNDLMQAYRLYTLALSGEAELGAMNRLKEQTPLNHTAAWTLAAAYAQAGQTEAAKKMIANLSTVVKAYRELSYSYGSDIRDRALILETLVKLNEKEKAFDLLKDLSKSLSNANYWMSTQEVAFSLRAISSFAGAEKRGNINLNYMVNGKEVNATSELPIVQIPVLMQGVKKESVSITNKGTGLVFVRVIAEGIPARGEEQEEKSNLELYVNYTDKKGNAINPQLIEQGTEFVAEVTIKHGGRSGAYQNMALTQIFPGGWEIVNDRMEQTDVSVKQDYFSYQDIRDDRVYTFFDIGYNYQKKYKVNLIATYAGTYYLPGASCEAMYDKGIYARTKGMEVKVVKQMPVE
ncbi:MAG: MG2 domain-containing protein [Flammeovirgaceae bacterium]|nr:MG2 domain-containing protein [Flammeovirgaceae bacterium]